MNNRLVAFGAGLAVTACLALPASAFAVPTATSSATATTTAFGTTTADNAANAAAAAKILSSDLSISDKLEATLALGKVNPNLAAKARAAVAKMPADFQAKQDALAAKAGLNGGYRELLQSVINPDDYECETGDLPTWLNAEYEKNWVGIALLLLVGAGNLVTYDALVYGAESRANTFGVDGALTDEMNRTTASLKRFWDIPTDIQVAPMHGRMLSDDARVTRVVSEVFQDPEWAPYQVDFLHTIFADHPELKGGDNPWMSFNAFAFDPQGDPFWESLGVTKKIVMGDGIMQGMEGIGLPVADVSRGILAHEYGHQVQYAKGLFDSPLTGPEATRRTELMADAMGTYSLVHKRGAALNAKRTLAVEKSFYNVGDCSYTSPGHHGTPNQRMRSSEWAVGVVGSASNQGHKLSSIQFATKFDTQLPVIVAPDAS